MPAGKKVKIPFGRIYATRSGDKGGNANLGVWGKTPEAYAFLKEFLTTKKLKELLKDMGGYEIERYEFPNLFAVNFYIRGVLGEGVAASLRSDPQAKTLGEYLRAKGCRGAGVYCSLITISSSWIKYCRKAGSCPAEKEVVR